MGTIPADYLVSAESLGCDGTGSGLGKRARRIASEHFRFFMILASRGLSRRLDANEKASDTIAVEDCRLNTCHTE